MPFILLVLSVKDRNHLWISEKRTWDLRWTPSQAQYPRHIPGMARGAKLCCVAYWDTLVTERSRCSGSVDFRAHIFGPVSSIDNVLLIHITHEPKNDGSPGVLSSLLRHWHFINYLDLKATLGKREKTMILFLIPQIVRKLS